MEKRLTCPFCKVEYSTTNIPRLIPSCGHTLCQNCIKQKLVQNDQQDSNTIVCPEDGITTTLEDNDIKIFPKNFAIMKLLTRMQAQSKTSSPKLQKEIKRQKKQKILETMVMNQQTTQQKTISDTPEKSQTLEQITIISSPKSTKKQQEQMCLIHNKPFEVICIQDCTRICSNCAIFGDHRNHDFKSAQDFQKDKLKKCELILEIIQKKQKSVEELEAKLSKQKTAKLIQQKKQSMIKSIKDNYFRLAECLYLSQKRTISKLNTMISLIEQKVMNLINNKQLFYDYQKWQQEAFSQIQGFESKDIIQHIKLLNYSKYRKDIIKEGNQILQNLFQKVDNFSYQKNQILDSIIIEYNTELDLKIMDYCSITEKLELVKNSSRLKIEEKQQYFPLIYINNPISPINFRVPTYNLDRKTSIVRQMIDKPLDKLVHQIDANEDLLLEEFKTQNIEKPVKQFDYQQSIGQISSIGNLSRRTSFAQSLQNSFVQNKTKTPLGQKKLNKPSTTKRKLKLPEKYQKIYDCILADTLQMVDLTNAQLGDQVTIQLVQSLFGKKCKVLKLIRNKLSDDAVAKMWPYFENITTLNLSQNFLTQKTIESLLANLHLLPNIRSITLSQNKIKQRVVKLRIEQIKKHDIIVSL